MPYRKRRKEWTVSDLSLVVKESLLGRQMFCAAEGVEASRAGLSPQRSLHDWSVADNELNHDYEVRDF
jgi:hypothetical protein